MTWHPAHVVIPTLAGVLLWTSVVLAQEPPGDAQQIQVQEIQTSVNELAALVAYARDRDLAAQGYAPPGWIQPEMEVYMQELDGRPSLIPYENFAKAVSDGKVSPEMGEQYDAWVQRQEAAEPTP